MSKKQIVRIAGIASAVIFAMGALFPILSIDFLGTSMSKSLIDTADWIFVMLNAVLIIVNVLLSEEISLDICALTAVFITIGELKPFFDGSLGEASSFVKKGFGFYCLLIGTILIVIVAVAHWFIKPSKGKTKKLKKPESRKCPYCAETIKVDALICRFCGSKLDPLPELEPEPTANDEDDNSWKGVAKAGGQLLLTIVMGVISLALCGFVIACVLVSSSGQEEQPDNSSQISESYYSEPYTEEVQHAETEVTTAATTTSPATTTTATTKATTTTTAATTPEPEEVIDTSHPYEAYFVQNDNYSSGAVDGAVPYIQLNSDGTFEFQCNMYMDVLKYTGTWEYMTSRWGINFVLNVTGCNRGKVSTTVQDTPIMLSYYDLNEQAEFSYDGDSLFGMTFPNSRFDVSYFNIIS